MNNSKTFKSRFNLIIHGSEIRSGTNNKLNFIKMKMLEKHKSKLQKGFEKQVKRQDAKKEVVEIILPIAVKLPKNFKGEYIHSITVYNNFWNGMNLKVLKNSFTKNSVGGMYGKFSINKDDKYILSFYGKKLLKNKKLRKQNQKTNI